METLCEVMGHKVAWAGSTPDLWVTDPSGRGHFLTARYTEDGALDESAMAARVQRFITLRIVRAVLLLLR